MSMDPSSQDLTLRHPGQATYSQYPPRNVEDLILYKESLRRQRALIEEQERQADIGLYLSGFQQQQVPQGILSAPVVVPHSFGASSSYPYMTTSANAAVNSARITEVESTPFQSTSSYIPMIQSSHNATIATSHVLPSSHGVRQARTPVGMPSNYISNPQKPTFVYDNTGAMQHMSTVFQQPSLHAGSSSTAFKYSSHSIVNGEGSSLNSRSPVQLNDEADNRSSQAKATAVQSTSLDLEYPSLSSQISPPAVPLDIRRESEVANGITGPTGPDESSHELLVLEQLLAEHEKWSEDASARIVQTVLSASTKVESTDSEAKANITLNNSSSTAPPLIQSAAASTSLARTLPIISNPQRSGSGTTSHSGQALPGTPQSLRPTSGIITPASADRNTLAQSILRALRPPSSKRKRGNRETDRLEETPLTKKARGLISSAGHLANAPYASGGFGERGRLTLDPTIPPAINHSPVYFYNYNQGLYAPPQGGTVRSLPPEGHRQMPQHVPMPKVQSVQPPVAQLSQVPSSHPEKTSVSSTKLSEKLPEGPSSHPEKPSMSSTKLSEKLPEGAKESGLRREPLFLPSSPSPTSNSPPFVSPSKKVNLPKSIPVVELGRLNLKPKIYIPKNQVSSNTGYTSATNNVDSLFGQPTGILASAMPSIVRKPDALSVSQTPLLDTKSTVSRLRSASQKKSRLGITPSGGLFYVLIPPLPGGRGKFLKGKEKEVIPRTNLERRRLHDDEDVVVREFLRRLIRRPCLWKDCPAILDSGEKLLKHVKYVHTAAPAHGKVYKCKWAECPSSGNYEDSEKLLRHLRGHATARIYCAYKNCHFQTLLSSQLAQHIDRVHRGDTLRPLALPVDVKPPPMSPLFDVLPSYLSVPLPVSARSIPSDRHQRIAPEILGEIISYTKATAGPRSRLRAVNVLQLEDLDLDVDDDCRFAWSEKPSKVFAPLTQLSPRVHEVDVLEGDLLRQPIIINPSGSRQTDPIRDPAPLPAVKPLGLSEKVSHIEQNVEGEDTAVEEVVRQTPLLPVREEVESREVEALL